MQIFLPPKEAQGKVRQSQGRAPANKLILGSIGTPPWPLNLRLNIKCIFHHSGMICQKSEENHTQKMKFILLNLYAIHIKIDLSRPRKILPNFSTFPNLPFCPECLSVDYMGTIRWQIPNALTISFIYNNQISAPKLDTTKSKLPTILVLIFFSIPPFGILTTHTSLGQFKPRVLIF